MSGIGELAYTLLLGWMRALVDWFWSMYSGTGNTGAWQWLLSNWKIWLIILLVGGVVVDWLMWVVRWRPYRLLFGRRAPAAGDAQAAYDGGVGYYDQDTAEMEAADWTETTGEWTDTYATLSEIDPDWAEGFVMDAEAEPLYDPDYDPMHPPQYVPPYMPPIEALNRWAPPEADDIAQEEDANEPVPDSMDAMDDTDEPDDIMFTEASEPEEEFFEADDVDVEEDESIAGEMAADETYLEDTELNKYSNPYDTNETEMTVDPNTTSYVPGSHRRRRSESAARPAPAEKKPADFDPFAPYDAYDAEEASAYTDGSGEAQAPAADDDGPLMYGRPTMWPGMHYGVVGNASDDTSAPQETASGAPTEDTYDPLFNPNATPMDSPTPRRRRRRLHEHIETSRPQEDPAPSERSRRRDDPPHYYEEDDDPRPRGKATPMPSWVDTESESSPRNARRQPQDTRPSRLVRPQAAEEEPKEAKRRWGRKRKDLQTVTGKPAKPRGLRRFTSTQEDPIAGLPPLDLTDPFLPAVRPNPDFESDDGEEYYDD